MNSLCKQLVWQLLTDTLGGCMYEEDTEEYLYLTHTLGHVWSGHTHIQTLKSTPTSIFIDNCGNREEASAHTLVSTIIWIQKKLIRCKHSFLNLNTEHTKKSPKYKHGLKEHVCLYLSQS